MSAIPLREPAFLVLTALAKRPQHGYTLLEDIEELSDGRVRLRPGSLYALLDRLRDAGLIEVDHEEVVASRLRRYYRLSEAGRATLTVELDALRRRAMAAESLLRQSRTEPTATPTDPPGHPAGDPSTAIWP